MIQYLGNLTVGDWLPTSVTMQAQLLAELNAKLAAQLALVASLQLTPPSISLSLDFAIKLVAAIEAQIALGIELPSLQIQLSIAFDFIAQLNIAIQLLLNLQIAFGTAGVHGYTYVGQAGNLGTELAAATSGGFPGGQPSDASNALILATSVPAAWAAIATVLKTT